MSDDFQEVSRPEEKPAMRGIVAALRATRQTGRAIRVRGNRATIAGYSGLLKAEGLRVRTKQDGDHVIAWTEPRENGHKA